MILSDLLNLRVFAADGEELGRVVDARFAVAGPEDHPLRTARMLGLIVSPRSNSSFMGYERTGVQSPALIADWFRHRGRGTFLVLWRDLASMDGRVVLRPDAVLYSPRLGGRDRG